MKDSRKNRPRRTERYRIGTPARERVTVSTKLEPATYQRLIEAASANHSSISTEVEQRLEKSLEPHFANHSLESFGAHVMAAFRMGGELAAQGRPYEEWIKDSEVYDRAVALALQALLSWRPQPLRDAAGNPIKVLGIQTTVSINPADAGKLHFITPDESKD